jgi:hypothetical protein
MITKVPVDAMTILLREGEFILMSKAPKSLNLAGRLTDYIEADVVWLICSFNSAVCWILLWGAL